MVRLVPGTITDNGYTWQCAELRDAANGANYLFGCHATVGCADNNDCWGNAVGTSRLVHGTLRRTTVPGFGGWRLSLN